MHHKVIAVRCKEWVGRSAAGRIKRDGVGMCEVAGRVAPELLRCEEHGVSQHAYWTRQPNAVNQRCCYYIAQYKMVGPGLQMRVEEEDADVGNTV